MDTVYYWLYYKRQTNTFLCPFSGFHNPVKLRLCILDFQMRVGSKSNPDIRMPHDILQRFGVHTALCHIGAEGVSTHMRGDLRKLNSVDFIVLGADMLKVMLPVKGDHRHLILVQKQESGVSVHHRFLRRFLPVGNDPAEASHDFGTHGDKPLTVLGFGVLNDVFHGVSSLQLMIHPDSLLFEVNIRNRQSAELRNTQACIKKDEDPIVILLNNKASYEIQIYGSPEKTLKRWRCSDVISG